MKTACFALAAALSAPAYAQKMRAKPGQKLDHKAVRIQLRPDPLAD